MSGLFEHLAAFDEGERTKSRKIVAVAQKRVADNFGAFLSNAEDAEDLKARLALVERDIQETVQAVVAEYSGETYDSTLAAVLAGWEDLPRSPNGQWGKTDSTEIGDSEEGVSNIESELADAPSAVGHESLSSTKEADAAWDGGGAVHREDLPKADASGLGDAVKPHINKDQAGNAKGYNKTEVPKTQESGSPEPTKRQKITDGRGDAMKGTSDYTHSDPDVLSTDTLKSQDLPTADDDAGFSDGAINSGPHTDTFNNSGQADPVGAEKAEGILSSTDPDKNPIAEIWQSDSQVQAAIKAYEESE